MHSSVHVTVVDGLAQTAELKLPLVQDEGGARLWGFMIYHQHVLALHQLQQTEQELRSTVAAVPHLPR